MGRVHRLVFLPVESEEFVEGVFVQAPVPAPTLALNGHGRSRASIVSHLAKGKLGECAAVRTDGHLSPLWGGSTIWTSSTEEL